MENYLNSNTIKALEKLINYIKESKDYKECLKLKKVISENKELTKLINEVRVSQKNMFAQTLKKKKKTNGWKIKSPKYK